MDLNRRIPNDPSWERSCAILAAYWRWALYDRIEPIRTRQWHCLLVRDILRHGVISSGGANRRLCVETSGDYATFQFPPLQRHDLVINSGPSSIPLRAPRLKRQVVEWRPWDRCTKLALALRPETLLR